VRVYANKIQEDILMEMNCYVNSIRSIKKGANEILQIKGILLHNIKIWDDMLRINQHREHQGIIEFYCDYSYVDKFRVGTMIKIVVDNRNYEMVEIKGESRR
jgi:hypothetical protein